MPDYRFDRTPGVHYSFSSNDDMDRVADALNKIAEFPFTLEWPGGETTFRNDQQVEAFVHAVGGKVETLEPLAMRAAKAYNEANMPIHPGMLFSDPKHRPIERYRVAISHADDGDFDWCFPTYCGLESEFLQHHCDMLLDFEDETTLALVAYECDKATEVPAVLRELLEERGL